MLNNSLQSAERGAEVLDAKTQTASATADETKDQAIERLSLLSHTDYALERDTVAAKFDIPVTYLDLDVKEARRKRKRSSNDNAMFKDAEPWEFPIDGPELFDEIRDTIKRYAVLPKHTDVAITLWSAFTYCIEAVHVAPLLVITSPEKRCGKTTVLSLLRRMVRRPLAASNIKPAAMYRSIELWHPTLLIDEADTFLREDEELRGIINSGHTRDTAFVIRVVGEGADMVPGRFSTWSAKAIAAIGSLSDTNTDRAVVVELRRKLPGEEVRKLRHFEDAFDDLRRKLIRFAEDNEAAIGGARPEIPDSLNDRAADNWEPLLAIADTVGGDWPKLAREAANALSNKGDEPESTKVQLLTDIKAYFTKTDHDRVSSQDLIEWLKGLETRPWADYKHGRAISPRQLAGLLRHFKIAPGTHRDAGGVFKGYVIEDFVDAFGRYLPSAKPAPNRLHQLQPCFNKENGGFSEVTSSKVLPQGNGELPLQNSHVTDVTDSRGGIGDEGESEVCL
jgi:putative DNA primase/helicase